jgi:RNA 3'-terminal phosphate cyclase (ATP)
MHYLRSCGYEASLKLDKAGFFPKGGGRITTTIRPSKRITPLNVTKREKLRRIFGISGVANLATSIATRQKRQVLQRLSGICPDIKINNTKLSSPGKGTVLLLVGEFSTEIDDVYTQCCYFGLGERGKPAEEVADEAIDKFERFLATDAALDEYLADQLLLPLAFANGISEFSTARITKHLLSNAEIIQLFSAARIDIVGELNQSGIVKITPQPYP